jgi:chitin deacetylase
MIGINIIYYPAQFLAAFDAGHDIAVHTWTHPYMTTLSNLDLLGQVGLLFFHMRLL